MFKNGTPIFWGKKINNNVYGIVPWPCQERIEEDNHIYTQKSFLQESYHEECKQKV